MVDKFREGSSLCRVFISHSEKDAKFVEYLSTVCFLLDIDCKVAEYELQAGTELWDKIKNMIENSYVVIPILTINGVQSEWVKKEIIMAKTLGKKIVPIVQDVAKENIPDEIKGVEYIPYDYENLAETLLKVALRLKEMKRNDLGFATHC